jgi:hypothetical protein
MQALNPKNTISDGNFIKYRCFNSKTFWFKNVAYNAKSEVYLLKQTIRVVKNKSPQKIFGCF